MALACKRGGEDLDAFVTGQQGCINQASLDVCGFQPRVTAENGLLVITRSQHVKQVFNGKSPSSNDRFATEDFRIARDAFEELLLFHEVKS